MRNADERRIMSESGRAVDAVAGQGAAVRWRIEHPLPARLLSIVVAVLALTAFAAAFAAPFHGAPPSAASLENPMQGQASAVNAGSGLYARLCASCHGPDATGSGNVPGLAHGPVQQASDGEAFWFITKGAVDDAMPSWAQLPAEKRWQLVTYVKSLSASPAAATASASGVQVAPPAPAPSAPFTDFRFEAPGTVRHVRLQDLPAAFATPSASNAPVIVSRPTGVLPIAPKGFKVNLYAEGLRLPRAIRTAPNGDVFVAESGAGRIRIFRGIDGSGKPTQSHTFAQGLNRPFGIDFYPHGPDPRWVYVADTDAVLRFPYPNGALESSAPPEHVVDLPHGRGHWTRDLRFSLDNKTLFVAVGSASNIDDPDLNPDERDRADILAFNADGQHPRVYASGIRNPSGLAIEPDSGALWCSVNERDGLGDNLVPDYVTSIRPSGFYGWPWWYLGTHQDPRLARRHSDLRDRVSTPDVLLQAHSAPLQLTFYEGTRFPANYHGDIFVTSH